MTMLEGMNRAIHYIEENLDGDIDYAEIARTLSRGLFRTYMGLYRQKRVKAALRSQRIHASPLL